METLLYLRYAQLVDILSLLTSSFNLRGAGSPVLGEVMLLDKEVEVGLEGDTVHRDLILAACLHAFVFVQHEYIGCCIV